MNDPDLKVSWYVNGVQLKTGHRFKTTQDFGYVALDILYTYPEDRYFVIFSLFEINDPFEFSSSVATTSARLSTRVATRQ